MNVCVRARARVCVYVRSSYFIKDIVAGRVRCGGKRKCRTTPCSKNADRVRW
jgi:hypothetical protein